MLQTPRDRLKGVKKEQTPTELINKLHDFYFSNEEKTIMESHYEVLSILKEYFKKKNAY